MTSFYWTETHLPFSWQMGTKLKLRWWREGSRWTTQEETRTADTGSKWRDGWGCHLVIEHRRVQSWQREKSNARLNVIPSFKSASAPLCSPPRHPGNTHSLTHSLTRATISLPINLGLSVRAPWQRITGVQTEDLGSGWKRRLIATPSKRTNCARGSTFKVTGCRRDGLDGKAKPTEGGKKKEKSCLDTLRRR